MMDTKEAAAEIRKELKARGWNSRDVSVRCHLYSMGSSINVEIKNPAVPLDIVEQISRDRERVHRCEITGDILNGGNRYVSARYSSEARRILARRQYDALMTALGTLSEEGGSAIATVTPWAGVRLLRHGLAEIWINGTWASQFSHDCEDGMIHGAYIVEANRPQ